MHVISLVLRMCIISFSIVLSWESLLQPVVARRGSLRSLTDWYVHVLIKSSTQLMVLQTPNIFRIRKTQPNGTHRIGIEASTLDMANATLDQRTRTRVVRLGGLHGRIRGWWEGEGKERKGKSGLSSLVLCHCWACQRQLRNDHQISG